MLDNSITMVSKIQGYAVVGINNKKMLVTLDSKTGLLIMNGCYNMKVLHGSVTTMGYTVAVNEAVPVYSGRHRALIPVTPVKTKKLVHSYHIESVVSAYCLNDGQISSLGFTKVSLVWFLITFECKSELLKYSYVIGS